jgi:hypothetical protein
LAKRGDFSFVITQSTLDIEVLNYIKENLQFGKIIQQSVKQRTHRFIVQDIKNIYLICLIFNGNIVFPTRKAKFLIFISMLNERLLKRRIKDLKLKLEPIKILDINILPSLNNN